MKLSLAATSTSAQTTVSFSGRKQKSQAAQASQIQQKADSFAKELKAIVEWDQVTHPTPVIKYVDIPKLQATAKKFIERQTKDITYPTPYMIGMTGGSASGKSFIKEKLIHQIQQKATDQVGWNQTKHGKVVDELELDSFYIDFEERRKTLGDVQFFQQTNLDEPAALTMNDAQKAVMRVKNGIATRRPDYYFPICTRKDGAVLLTPVPFVVVEGLFSMVPNKLRKLFDLKIFVDTDRETITKRWWDRAPKRNIKDDEGGHALFKRTMEMFDVHVAPTLKKANMVLNGAAEATSLDATLDKLTSLMVKTFYPGQKA